MSTKIKINTDLSGHKAGDTITVTNKTAAYLTERGLVEEPKPRTSTKKADDKTE